MGIHVDPSDGRHSHEREGHERHGRLQTEIPTVTAGKETARHRRGFGMRTDMTDCLSPSSFSAS